MLYPVKNIKTFQGFDLSTVCNYTMSKSDPHFLKKFVFNEGPLKMIKNVNKKRSNNKVNLNVECKL